MIRTTPGTVAAVRSIVLTLSLCALVVGAGASQAPALQPPVCASRATLDDLLARSADAFGARDSVLGLRLGHQA